VSVLISSGVRVLTIGLLERTFAQQGSPIIVKIVETPRDPTGLADVLIGALGLTGVLVVMALALGLLVGGILFFARSRRPLS
jgi:hypothetical protein